MSFKKSVKNGKKAVGVPQEIVRAYDPKLPQPTTRADLLEHWIDLSLDEKTANKVLWITEGATKVARMTDELTCPVLDGPLRYEFSPQVVCKEGIEGFRAYWEVEYTGWVVVGVASADAGRRAADGSCGIGENPESAGIGWAGNYYQMWFDSESKDIRKVPEYPILGFYLDQPAGLIVFYAVSEVDGKKEATLLTKCKMNLKKKLFPVFWCGNNSSCLILKKTE